MSQLLPDALFGVDGTESPDPSGREDWRDTPQLPPLTLPDLREAIAATLTKDLPGPADQDPDVASAPPPADQHTAPKPTITPVDAPAQDPPQPTVDLPQQPTVTAPPPAAQAVAAPTGAGGPGHQGSRPTAAVPIAPAKPRGPGINLPGRVGPQDFGLRWQSRSSNGGASAAFVISLIVIGVLLYAIVTEITGAILRLIP